MKAKCLVKYLLWRLELDLKGFHGPTPMIFIVDIFALLKLQLKDITAMKNRTISISAQTWVSKPVNHHSRTLCSQASAYRAKTYERTLRHRAVYWEDCAAVCILRIQLDIVQEFPSFIWLCTPSAFRQMSRPPKISYDKKAKWNTKI